MHAPDATVFIGGSQLRALFHITGIFVSQAIGGVVTLVSKFWVPTDVISKRVWEEGRIISVDDQDNEREGVFWDTHTFDVSDQAMDDVRCEVQGRPFVVTPPFCLIDVFGGDFTFVAEKSFTVAATAHDSKRQASGVANAVGCTSSRTRLR